MKIYLYGKYADYYTLIDDIDSDLGTIKWHGGTDSWNSTKIIACKTINYIKIYLHRLILERKLNKKISKGFETDHKNRNNLDNRRNNLRLVPKIRNRCNSNANKNSRFKYKGVCCSLTGSTSKVAAQIRVNGKLLHLGLFYNEIEAAKAYDKAAKKYFGEFARTNF